MFDDASIKKRFEKVNKSSTFSRIIRIFGLHNKRALDLGCGYGEYMVKFGQNCLGITTTEDEIRYGKENGLDIRKGNVEFIDELNLPGDFELIWANNLFEHLLSPHAFLIKLKRVAKDKSLLILGVPVIPRFVFLMKLNRFRGALASNHISFFTRESLKLTVEYAGWKVVEARSFQFDWSFLDNIYSLIAPHIYVVAENNSNFRYPDKKVKEWEGEDHYKHLFNITRGE